mgnify:CR=1 FL=1
MSAHAWNDQIIIMVMTPNIVLLSQLLMVWRQYASEISGQDRISLHRLSVHYAGLTDSLGFSGINDEPGSCLQ